MSDFLQTLRVRVSSASPTTIVFPEANDERILQAALALQQEKILKPLLVCTPDDVSAVEALGLQYTTIEKEKANELAQLLLEIRSSKVGTNDELTPEEAERLSNDPLIYGMYLVRLGDGDGLVAGATRTTKDVLTGALWLIGKAEKIQTVSSAFYMSVPDFRGKGEEILTFADCAVVPEPTAEQLADIAVASADARRQIVGDEPRIAMLSYSTHGSGGESTSIQKVKDALKLVQSQRSDIVIDGEIQVDAALVESISQKKAPDSPLHGSANVLVFPSLEAANIAYKLVERLSPSSQAIGPILQGMKKPISDLSRGAKTDDIVDVAIITASQVAGNKK